MIMSVEKHLINLAFSKYEWGYPFDLAFPKGRYSDSERVHLKIGWDKAERYHDRLRREADGRAEAYRQEVDEFERVEQAFEAAKAELLTAFGEAGGNAVINYLAAWMAKFERDRDAT